MGIRKFTKHSARLRPEWKTAMPIVVFNVDVIELGAWGEAPGSIDRDN